MFNALDYDALVAAGEASMIILKSGHPSPPRAGLPSCTRSEIVAYLDQAGHRLAEAHRYVLPDGTIGASGRADPKRLWKDGILYVAWWG
jgi:hypothetical protein